MKNCSPESMQKALFNRKMTGYPSISITIGEAGDADGEMGMDAEAEQERKELDLAPDAPVLADDGEDADGETLGEDPTDGGGLEEASHSGLFGQGSLLKRALGKKPMLAKR